MVDNHSPSRNPLLRSFLFLVVPIFLSLSACSNPDVPLVPDFITIPPVISIGNQISESNSAALLSLGQDLRFENISLEEGLSQSTVFSIIQDSQGFMWFGTEDGLNKYDGFNFTIYKSDLENESSLSSNWIETLFLDHEGRLWIGTANGLDRFNQEDGSFTHYKNDPADPNSISGNHITAIYQDNHGIMWVGTLKGGINKFDPASERFVQFRHDPADPFSISSDGVSTIIGDKDGFLWVGTYDAGINFLNQNDSSWMRIGSWSGSSLGLSNQHISVIMEDHTGNLWIGTDGGGLSRLTISEAEKHKLLEGISLGKTNYRIKHYQHNPNNTSSLSSNNVTALRQDNDGIIWIGTRTGGLNILVPDSDVFRIFQHNPHLEDGFENDWILSIYQDNEGIYWFGTIGGGINKLGLGWKNFPLFRNNPNNPASLSDDMVRYFLPDRDSLWIGSMFGGVDKLNTITGDWQHFVNDPSDLDSLSSNFVSIIYKDQSGNLWIGTSSGLDKYDPENGSFVHYLPKPEAGPGSHDNNIRAIYEKPTGHYWIGTRSGLYHYDLVLDQWDKLEFKISDDPHNLNNVWILNILEDQDETLWVTTWGAGLFRIDPVTEHITHFHNDPDNPDSLGNNTLLSIYQDQSGSLWFGSTGGLIKYRSETGVFTNYRENDGLPNETIYCVLGDSEDNIWISTNLGLSKFTPSEEIFQNYTVNDGLQSNEFNGNSCNYGINGMMIFGGINGFNLFSPENVKSNYYSPPVVITSIVIDGNQRLYDLMEGQKSEIILKWPENSFEFEYAALSFNQPEQNRYAFYLEGFDNNWNNVGSRRYGKYTNLPGGTYTLHVIGSNDDGIWNQEGKSIQITVVPPLWETWWFGGLLIVVVSGMVFGGFKLRVRNLENRSRELENQVIDRTEKLMEAQIALKETDLQRAVIEERNRLARELHDSVTQSLYSLTLFTEAARHLAEEAGTDKLEGYLGQIGSLGLRL